MEFRTQIESPKQREVTVGYEDEILFFGSCFSMNIGDWLERHFFSTTINPFGTQYNPLSIAQGIHKLLSKHQYHVEDLFLHQEIYRHDDFHSLYADSQLEIALQKMNQQVEIGAAALERCSKLFITFGTAWVYRHKTGGEIVNNCHKQKESMFTRSRASVEDIVSIWRPLIAELLAKQPDRQIIFTVSPIRHIKDSLHGNQLSKATLLLAIDQLQQHFPQNTFYFPAYEMLLDDLRDYRFYADDMTHPSAMAIEYIQEEFQKRYFNKETTEIYLACKKAAQALAHRPNNPDGEGYKLFLTQNIQKLQQLHGKYPYFRTEKAVHAFQERL